MVVKILATLLLAGQIFVGVAELHEEIVEHLYKETSPLQQRGYIILYEDVEDQPTTISCTRPDDNMNGTSLSANDESVPKDRIPNGITKKWVVPNGVQLHSPVLESKTDAKNGLAQDQEIDLKDRHTGLNHDNEKGGVGPIHDDFYGEGKGIGTVGTGHDLKGRDYLLEERQKEKPWVELTSEDDLMFHNPDASLQGLYICTYGDVEGRNPSSQTIIMVHVFARSKFDVSGRLKVAFVATVVFMAVSAIAWGASVKCKRSRGSHYFLAKRCEENINISTSSDVIEKDRISVHQMEF